MTPTQDLVVLIFSLVYLGMILGGLPLLQLDRTGVALLGAIALIGLDAVSMQEAAQAVHIPTVILLFAFMVVSAQMRLGGFYDWATRALAALPLPPQALLAALIAVSAVLSAVFSNDIVCLAVAPVLVDAARRRGLNPLPLLLALACASNIGSAATLIGNPQNMLIGETLKLDFARHLRDAALPVLLALALTWAIVARLFRGRWLGPVEASAQAPEIMLDRWQTAKGLAVALGIVACFLLTDWPREVVALTGAGLLLLSRKLHSRDMLGLVDHELLLLFIGLFIVNHAFAATGLPQQAVDALAQAGIALGDPAPLALTTFGLSNLVSNVPAVMLLLPHATHALAGLTLTLVSTLAGNLLIVGSIANIIVVDAAQRRGVTLDWRTHARVGVPVTLGSMAICAAWLASLA
ncbi:SLC13 family permease [Sphaerotilus mobilis]|uniref:YbiR family transporter n=1 Tax=Sphaerotilus mobilis TaxID=47994 RepID=A0A4Q7LSF6_9BURK|nr:SLC13 family permease [Sphaerotilus mobilis]RZS56559.1 YbiR family transporter [Sphaerotilus mobilis]